jgi:predicted ATPase
MGELRAPTLGREGELATLAGALGRIRGGGSGRLVVVAPPGLGKTRLVEEFAARSGVAVWRARLRPDVLAPYQAVAELVGCGLAAVPVGEEPESWLCERLRGRGFTDEPAAVVARELVSVARSTSTTAIEDRETLFAAWAAGLDALAGDAAVVWVVEDAHWAGGDLLAFLDYAGSAASTGGRLLIVTARPSLLEHAPAWRDTRHALHLRALAPAHAQDLVTALVGDALPTRLVEAIAQRSDGTPLFIEELLRSWISVGVLTRSPSGWTLSAPTEDVPVPPTVQAIYGAQLDDLPPLARLVVRRASVAGRRFPTGVLPPLGIRDVEQGIQPLATRALLIGPSHEPPLGETYAYRHALLRDCAYASLSRAERARLHVRLAGWLEQAAGPRWTEVAEVIARHYAAALDEAPGLVTSVDELPRAELARLAAAWFERAATVASGVAAQDAATDLLRRSLELTEDAPLDRARRLHALGELVAFSADMEAGAQAVEEAVELARPFAERGEREAVALHASACASLAAIFIEQLRFEEARSVVDGALVHAPPLEGGTARLLIFRAHSRLALTNEAEPALADAARAQAIAQALDDPELELEARAWFARLHIPHAELVQADWTDVERQARELGRWTTAAAAVERQAVVELAGDSVASVLPLADRLQQTAATYGVTESVAWADYLRAEACAALGRWDEAVGAGRRAIDLAQQNAYHRVAIRTWMVVAAIAGARRDRTLAEELAAWFLPRRERLPRSPFSQLAMLAFDVNLARNGMEVPAPQPNDAVLAAFAIPWRQPSLFAQRDDVLAAWLATGDVAAAEAAVGRLERPATRLSSAADGVHRARLALARGQSDDAAVHARGALAAARAIANPWWAAKAVRRLEEAGAADEALGDEARRLESELGLPDPA